MSNKTILFADDSATMRTIMEKTFAAEPFDVVTVPSGEAAIAKAREIKPDVLIVDAGMVGMSGYDVCKAARGDAAIGGTPIIIMSGVSHPYDEGRGRDVGATEHIKKPFDTTQVIAKVMELASLPKAAPARPAVAAAPAPALAAALAVAPLKPVVGPAVQPAAQPVAAKPPVEKPPAIVAPQRPAAAPMAAAKQAPTKGTMEFGRPSIKSPEPVQPAPAKPAAAPAPAQPLRAAPEPIELKKEPAPLPAAAFQVSTLAELAQMDEHGRPRAPLGHEDAIELSPQRPAAKPAPEFPVQEAVKEHIRVAADDVASRVSGVTPEQVDAIRALSVEIIERVVWEVVPDLAEAIIKEELKKLLEE